MGTFKKGYIIPLVRMMSKVMAFADTSVVLRRNSLVPGYLDTYLDTWYQGKNCFEPRQSKNYFPALNLYT